jgi:SpoVK/Ycf46/Vps4 family AAA+-type ATPase
MIQFQTNSFTGAELENVCREAAFIALREHFNADIVVCVNSLFLLVYFLDINFFYQTKEHFTKAYELVRQNIRRHPQNSNTKFEFTPQ